MSRGSPRTTAPARPASLLTPWSRMAVGLIAALSIADPTAAQGFLPIAYLDVADTHAGAAAADDDSCSIQPTRGRGRHGGGFLVLGLLALVGLASRGAGAHRARTGREAGAGRATTTRDE